MTVLSTTLAGVNVWRLSGAVTDAELKTAWAGLIVNNRYLLARTLYIDDTCSLVNVRGTYYIDSQNLGIVLHLSRNKANTLFRNWFFTQTVGLSVGARSNFVRFTNGTTITNSASDGIDMQGGGMMYAVVGNPGGGDPRYLNEMMFGSLDGTLVTSSAWTEQELEPTSIGTIWRGLNIQKAAGYPILSATGGTQRQVIYRSNFNTESATLRLIRPYYNNSVCYVSSVIRRQGAAVTSNLLDTYGSNGGCVIMALNNYLDESWFGASRTNFAGANWNSGNRIIGGVMKKIQVQPSTLIRTYDSRSTTVSQKSTFSETTSDFLTGTDSTTSDASTGRAQIVCVGAIATGGSIAITRYTGQRFTLQKFGYRVQVETPDMTFGDDDLSAFSPITMTAQDGIARTQAAITAATSLTSFQDLLEELHNLAIGLVGANSYNAYSGGNLFTFAGGVLTTAFTSVTVDATAASKISYNAATNALTIKSSVLVSTSAVTMWSNTAGAISLANGAAIQGLYESSAGPSTTIELTVGAGSSIYVGNNATGVTKVFNAGVSAGTYRAYFAPGDNTAVLCARENYPYTRWSEVITPSGGLIERTIVDVEDVGITQATLATVLAYTAIDTPSKRYDRTAAFRLTEQGIKLGQISTRSGTSIENGTFSFVVRADAAAVFSLTGSVFTIKASSYDADAKYTKEICTPPATFTAYASEIITVSIEDANGNSRCLIQGTTNDLVDVWKITNATPVADFATGTKLASDIGNGAYRWIGLDGFKLVFNNKDNGIYRYCSMAKGDYTAGWYLYDSPTGGLTQEQSTVLNTINVKNNQIFTEVNSITVGFDETTDSLHEIRAAIDKKPTLAEIEGSGVLAKTTDTLNANIVQVNAVPVSGTGAEGDEWGPAA